MHSQRIEWIDVAKGIAIILMVAGHTTIPKLISNFIWAFHMPLFFIASGLCTKWEEGVTYGDYIIKKTISLLIPFIIYSIIELPIAIKIGATTFDRWIVSGWQGIALWFIPVLYLSLLISKWVLNIVSVYMRVALIAFLLVIGVVLCYFDIGHNWTLSSIPYATFLIILGAYSKRWIQAINSTKWYYVIGALIVTIVVSQIWRLDMAWNHISPVIPITVGACSGTYLVFCISSYICIYRKPIKAILSAIGKDTYIILAFSQIIIMSMIHYTEWSSPVRYLIMILALIILKHLKDLINRVIGFKIL